MDGESNHLMDPEKILDKNAFQKQSSNIVNNIDIVEWQEDDKNPVPEVRKAKMIYTVDDEVSNTEAPTTDQHQLNIFATSNKTGTNGDSMATQETQSKVFHKEDYEVIDPLFKKHTDYYDLNESCVIGTASNYLSWWLHKDGSLVHKGMYKWTL